MYCKHTHLFVRAYNHVHVSLVRVFVIFELYCPVYYVFALYHKTVCEYLRCNDVIAALSHYCGVSAGRIILSTASRI